jgi:ligand-binding SRPBCC domain-containing protein
MEFCFDVEIPAAREEVFAFFAAPRNLERLHRGDPTLKVLEFGERLVDGGGLRCALAIAPFFTLSLVLRQRSVQPPERFVHERVAGDSPFERFVHVHEFLPTPRGTLFRDRLDVELALRFGGEMATRQLLAPRLRRSFERRGRALLDAASRGELRQPALATSSATTH